jgi:hypothetical protein
VLQQDLVVLVKNGRLVRAHFMQVEVAELLDTANMVVVQVAALWVAARVEQAMLIPAVAAAVVYLPAVLQAEPVVQA